MSNFDRQIERETGAVRKGVERFYTQLQRDVEKGREFDGPVGQALTRELMQRFVPEVEALHKEAMAAITQNLIKGQRKSAWHDAILALPAPDTAYIAIRTCLASAGGSEQMTSRLVLAKKIGRMINLEIRWRTMRDAEADRDKAATEPPYNRLKYLLRVEPGSRLSTAGAGGGQAGANIVKRIGTSGTLYGETGYDTVTNEDLWPWPYETRLKTDLAESTSRSREVKWRCGALRIRTGFGPSH